MMSLLSPPTGQKNQKCTISWQKPREDSITKRCCTILRSMATKWICTSFLFPWTFSLLFGLCASVRWEKYTITWQTAEGGGGLQFNDSFFLTFWRCLFSWLFEQIRFINDFLTSLFSTACGLFWNVITVLLVIVLFTKRDPWYARDCGNLSIHFPDLHPDTQGSGGWTKCWWNFTVLILFYCVFRIWRFILLLFFRAVFHFELLRTVSSCSV